MAYESYMNSSEANRGQALSVPLISVPVIALDVCYSPNREKEYNNPNELCFPEEKSEFRHTYHYEGSTRARCLSQETRIGDKSQKY